MTKDTRPPPTHKGLLENHDNKTTLKIPWAFYTFKSCVVTLSFNAPLQQQSGHHRQKPMET